MTRADVQKAVMQALAAVAPEIDPSSLRGNANLRDQVDLDSMDFLRLLIEVNRRLGVEFLESDYDQLSTLDRVVDYACSRLGVPAGSS